MGSRIGKHMRTGLSLLVAICMAVTLCPATALAIPTPDDAQEAVDAWVPEAGEADGASGAQTTISVSTYSTFRCVESTGPTGTITVAASKQENTDSGRLTARFEGARPYQTAGHGTSSPHYVMELTWTKDGRANDAYKITRALNAPSASVTAFDVDCSLNSIFGDADREGAYVFSMTLVGEGDMRAQGTTFASFTISDSTFTKDLIDNAGNTPYTQVRGSFDDAAILSVTDITGATAGSNAATLGMLQDQAGDKGIAEAWTIDIVNGSLLPAPTLFHSAKEITIDLTADTRDKLVALAEGESFTIVSLVNGEQHSVTFTKGTTVDGVITFTSTTTDDDGVPLEATLRVPAGGGNESLTFSTAGLGGTLGAFGLAFASSAGSYTAQVIAHNGTVSPSEQVTRPVGTKAAFQLAPASGYLLADPTITVTPSGAAYALEGNTLTVNGTAGQSITVNVTFQKYEDPDPGNPDDPVVPAVVDEVSVTGHCDAPSNAIAGDPVAESIIEATYTKVDNDGVAASETSQGAQLTLSRVRAGTPVLLNFKVVKAGYVVKGVKTAATQAGLAAAPLQTVTGTTYGIAAMTDATKFVQVEYEAGVQPPTLDVTHMVTGLAGENGTVSGSVDPGVTHGNYFTSTVRAYSEYVIDHVWVFAGTLSAVPASGAGAIADLTSAAQGKKTYDAYLTSVTEDMTVVATFKRGPVSINIAQVPGGTLSLNGVTGEPPYQVEAGNRTFTCTVQDGYRFDGVYQGSTKLELSALGSGVGTSGGSFTLDIGSSTTITPVFVPEEMPPTTEYAYATVITDGNGAVNPEGGVTFAQGSALTLNFSTVEGKETWRASEVTVSAGSASRSQTLTQSDWGSYVFDPTAAPWNQLPTNSVYIISVSFTDQATPSQPNPPELPKQAHIQMSTTAGGQISPAGALQGGQQVYGVTAGVRQTFTLIPDEGYHVDKVWMNVDAAGAVVDQMRDVTNASVNGTPLVSGSTLAFTPVADATYKVLVEFKANEEAPVLRWTVETSVDGVGGSVTPSDTSQMQDGQVQTFTFVNQTGYQLASVMVQTTQESSFAGVLAQNMTNMVVDKKLQLTINANTRVVATFEKIPGGTTPEPEKKTFTLTTSKEGNGTVSPESAQTLYVDSSLTLSFKADRGYQLEAVEVTCANPALNIAPKISDMNEDNGTYSYLFGLPSNVDKDSFADRTVNVKAIFAKVDISYTVSVQTKGPDDASAVPTNQNAAYGYVSPGYQDGTVQVASGGSQMFYFIERAGYVVEGVYVNGQRVAGGVSSYQLAGVTGNTTLLVEYKANQNAGGTVEDELVDVVASVTGGHGQISPASARVPEGGSVTYALVPDDGYKVSTLTVDGVDQTAQVSGNAYTFAPVGKLAGGAAHRVVVTFTQDGGSTGPGGEERPPVVETPLHQVFVQVTGSGSGTVTPGGFKTGDAQGAVEVPDGGQQTFSFLPAEDAPEGMVNVLDYIEIQRGGLINRVENAAGSYTLFNVKSDMTLVVAFKQVQKGGSEDNKPTYERYTVTAEAGDGGSIVPSGETVVNAGAGLTFRMVPTEGYHLSYVAVDANATGGNATYVPASELADSCYTFANIQADHNIRAVFAADGSSVEESFTAYTIDLDGTLVRASLNGVVNVKEGTSQTLVLTPTYGSQIAAVRVVSALDPARVLWQKSVSGAASRQAVEVPLTYVADVKSAVVLVDFGPSYGDEGGDAPVAYMVTTSVAADDAGNKLGTITPGGTQMLPAGSDVTFTMVPFSGCTVDSVTANGNPVAFTTTDGYYQFTATDLSGALNVVAKFRRVAADENVPTPGKTASISFNVHGAGSVQPASPAQVKPGDSLTITLVPNDGNKLGTLTVGGKDVTADVQPLANGSYTYTIANVQADTTVEATFVNSEDGSIDTTTNDLNVNVKVEVKVGGNVYGGTVDPGYPLTLSPGDSQMFLIKPADGFYVAGAQVQYADGSTMAAQVQPWQPSYGQTRAAQPQGAEAAQVAQGAEAAQTAQVSSIGGQTAAGAGQARAAENEQKPYSYVRVNDIRQSFVLLVQLDDCMNDPANTSHTYYVYGSAADDLVTVDPGVSGNGTVRPGDNTDVVGEGGDKTLIITPGTDENGDAEELKSITIHGTTIDLTGDDVRGPDGKQDPQKVVDKVKDSGVLLPGEDFKWVPEPAPGHYELTLKAEQGEDGKWTIDQPTVDFTGAGPAFTNRVTLRAFEIDAATGNRVPVDGAVLKIKATRLEDGKTAVNAPIDLAYGGAVRIEAELLSGDYELVSIEPDDTGMVTTTPNAKTRAAEGLEAQDAAANTFYAYGPGSILATVQKKAGANDPNDPNNPNDPSGQGVYYIEATAGTGGTISAAKTSYAVGETAQFTLTPNAGYQVASITLNGQKSDYTSRTYTVPKELCVKDAHVTVHVEFKATMPAAGDPQSTAGTRLLRTLQSLASTGDNGAPMAMGLLAVAFGALGVAVLLGSRRRKALALAAHIERDEHDMAD